MQGALRRSAGGARGSAWGGSGLREQHSANPRNLYTLLRPLSSWIINRGLVQRQAAF